MKAIIRGVALTAVCAVALPACSSTTTSTHSGGPAPCTSGPIFNSAAFHPCWLAANVNAVGAPVYGGTLKIEGDEDLSAFLDPQGEYGAVGDIVERAFTRQLVSYPASPNLPKAESIVPDAATAMPTISADGRTYTFHIRGGIMWNTSPARQVTSVDFERGIERNCDPTLASDGNPTYYMTTILGFASFCSAFRALGPASTAAERAAYINGHANDVPGIQTPNTSEIVFTLTQPATDFLNILALPFASAAPVEDLRFLPATPHEPIYTYSDGPYQISNYDLARDPTTKEWVGQELDLDHNPAWSQSSDPIRHQYVKEIDIKLNLPGADAIDKVQDDLETGVADLAWDTEVPAGSIDDLTSPSWNPQYGAFPGSGLRPVIRFNVKSPNNNGALGKLPVRQALEYAINKVAIGDVFGGSSLTQPLNQVIPPGAEGYVPINDYKTPGNEGDPGKCKSMLAAAGYPDGLKLTDIYIAYVKTGPLIAQEVASDLQKCGITVAGDPVDATKGPAYFADAIFAGDDVLEKPTTWDITSTTGWGPDWDGPNNGRAILPELYAPPLIGGYDDPRVDDLIKEAESALKLNDASNLWHEADALLMADAALIPVEVEIHPLFRSQRVHNAIFSPFTSSYDITQVWLPTTP